MGDRKTRKVIADLSGGRNGVDAPTSPLFRDNQCLDAVNVDYYQTAFARKRNGISASGVSFSSGGPFTGKLSALARHVPGTDETAAEEWAVGDASPPVVGRKAGATTFTAPTLKDALTGNAWDVSFASINGKLFLAYKSAQGRLHVWDGSTVRRAGLPTPGAFPSVANGGGAGAYPAVARYYRMRWTEQSGGITIRRSEPSTRTNAATPDGAHANITVTQATPPGEGETHWELEASADGVSFFVISTAAVGTTTIADTLAPSTYVNGDLSPLTGTYTLQKSYRFIAADQGRLLGFGSNTSTDKQNRIELSGVVGSLDVGDAERVDTTTNYYVDLDENDSGVPTGLIGPVFGNFYAFKNKQFWELSKTGSPTKPYQTNAISKAIGCVFHRACCLGDDAIGNPALYFLSHRGMYRYGVHGLEYIGKGIEDYILGPTATINLAASNVVAHCTYHADKRQVWVWWATGSSNDPNQMGIFDVTTGGWSRVPTGDKLANARCSAALPNTLGVTMSRDLKPYVGSATTANKIYKADDSSVTDDDGTAFQAYVTTKPFEPGGPGFNGEVADPLLLAKVGTGVTITASVIQDFDPALTQTGTALLTAAGTETRVSRRLEGAALAGASFMQVQIGDAAAVSNGWTLDRLLIPYAQQEAVSA